MSVSARAETIAQSRVAWFASRLADYYDLGKPRIMYLLLITTAAAMLMAAKGMPPLALFGWTMLGGALAAMSAGTLNCVYDAGIDRLMRRTQSRPIPAQRISVVAATTHAVVMGVLSFCIFYFRVIPLAAWLSLAGNIYYVVIYTMWLKRRTPQNIVIGGAAGAMPPLVGWAAVTGEVSLLAAYLFAIIFFWTPPHFWALALLIKAEYEKARVPMLPIVAGEDVTRYQILLYTVQLVAVTVLVYSFHLAGLFYLGSALALGGLFLYYAVRLRREANRAAALTLYKYSLLYLALIFAAVVVDRQLFP